MSNILAGIGRGQLEVLEDRVSKRRSIFQKYKQELESESIRFLEEEEGFYSNRWLSCILTESREMREGIRLLLESENIECRPLWKPMHQQPIFADAPRYINGVSDELFEKGLCLPSGSNLTDHDLDRVVKTLKSYFN
ncbi:MAG: DegT/DnrJ/EryC1/StrS family aminotransferase, partial [Bacteroidia bacterium]|nr:DegT/DnrJ/EryC1/StrS family aminotransferase [Bacteroidia bacterium]